MKANRCAWLVISAGAALSANARANPPVVTNEYQHGRVMGHLYVNAATGEVVRGATGSRLSDLYWENDDIAGSCNFFVGQDNPARDTAATGRVKFGSAVVHWGDTPCAHTDGYDIAYATNVGIDTAGTGIAGYSLINTFIDDYDGAIDPGGGSSAGITALVIADIAGGDATLGTTLFQGWIYTIDLEGSGLEFGWGDASGACDDLDGDGRHDFGYSYEFDQGQAAPKGVCGPFMVRPASLGGSGTATGCPDGYDWFNQLAGSGSFSDYVGQLWFGGGDCAASPARPYASLLMNLYGEADPCAAIDFHADGVINLSDRMVFLGLYDAQDPAADITGDGVVDFQDFVEFTSRYATCGGGDEGDKTDDLARENLQIPQPVLTHGATRVEIDFAGDRRADLTGGTVPGSNPFVAGIGESMNSVTYTPGTDTTTLIISGPDGIPIGSPSVKWKVGYEARGENRGARDVRWAGPDRAVVSVPMASTDILYDPATGKALITIKNPTVKTIKLAGMGYNTMACATRPEFLAPESLPALIAAPGLDGALNPGQSKSLSVPVTLAPDQTLVVSGVVTFTGPSAGEPFATAGGSNASIWTFAGVPPICDVDLTGDCLTDFSDFLEFLNRLEAEDATIDFNHDGITEFPDYLEFLNQYNRCH